MERLPVSRYYLFTVLAIGGGILDLWSKHAVFPLVCLAVGQRLLDLGSTHRAAKKSERRCTFRNGPRDGLAICPD